MGCREFYSPALPQGYRHVDCRSNQARCYGPSRGNDTTARKSHRTATPRPRSGPRRPSVLACKQTQSVTRRGRRGSLLPGAKIHCPAPIWVHVTSPADPPPAPSAAPTTEPKDTASRHSSPAVRVDRGIPPKSKAKAPHTTIVRGAPSACSIPPDYTFPLAAKGNRCLRLALQQGKQAK